MRIYTMLFAAALAVLAGCARKPVRADAAAVPVGGEVVFVTPAAGREKAADPPAQERKPVLEKPEAQAPERPVITFPHAETQHVRITSYDPFDGKSELKIDLKELADEFCYPYDGEFLSGYGYRGASMHTGVDIRARKNDTIRTALPGVVRMSKNYSGYGNVVVVRHYNGLESVYAHNTRNLVEPGDVVGTGGAIALAGRTGRATTDHLHFELRVMGQHFNPGVMIDPASRTLCPGEMIITRKAGKISAENPSRKADYVSAPQGAQAQAGSAPGENNAAAKTHTVARGDTLYRISRLYGTTVAEVCALNGISESAVLSIGQKLKVR